MRSLKRLFLSSTAMVIPLLITTNSYCCSIIGYLGEGSSQAVVEEGLTRLEYRGYDSAGFAGLDEQGSLFVRKAVGRVKNLSSKLESDPKESHIGIGHTRWATHGKPTEANAHPHINSDGKIAVVHNGIISNYTDLREKLQADGHAFLSQTDTEVIPHVLEVSLNKNSGNLKAAMQETVNTLHGSFAFLGVLDHQSDTLVAARKSSELAIGLGESGVFVASDPKAFAGKVTQVIYPPDESFALISRTGIQLFKFDGTQLPVVPEAYNISAEEFDKHGYEHYMLKEIFEQPFVIRRLVSHYEALRHQKQSEFGSNLFKEFGITSEVARNLKSIQFFACGTSAHAANIGEHFFENIAGIPAQTHLASEFKHRKVHKDENTLFLAISQSGTTADVMIALRRIGEHEMPVCAITNNPDSALGREAKGRLPLQAGPEVAVASTKAFTAQVSALYYLANAIALEKGLISEEQMDQAGKNLVQAGDALMSSLEKFRPRFQKTQVEQNSSLSLSSSENESESLVERLSQAPHFMFLGRQVGYPFALEAALKLKEITYIPAQGYASGELKHGSIALIDSKVPVVVFSHQDSEIYHMVYDNAREAQARNGQIIAFAFEGQKELIELAGKNAFVFPRVAPLLEPLVQSGLMQMMAYEIAKTLGKDIDKPRNLAKSVTVE